MPPPAPLKPPSRVYLTGFMGSGKSTVAPLLARLLGFRSTDLDARIERGRGKTVTEIFSTGGEEEFRLLEREALLETAGMENVVVSLGGGTLGFGKNELFVRSAGTLVYLRVDFETLWSRVRDKEDRPLLAGPGGSGQMRRRLEELFAVREPWYNRADLVIDAGDRPPETVAELIAAALAGRTGPSGG
jgi:shikimate kinase